MQRFTKMDITVWECKHVSKHSTFYNFYFVSYSTPQRCTTMLFATITMIYACMQFHTALSSQNYLHQHHIPHKRIFHIVSCHCYGTNDKKGPNIDLRRTVMSILQGYLIYLNRINSLFYPITTNNKLNKHLCLIQPLTSI